MFARAEAPKRRKPRARARFLYRDGATLAGKTRDGTSIRSEEDSQPVPARGKRASARNSARTLPSPCGRLFLPGTVRKDSTFLLYANVTTTAKRAPLSEILANGGEPPPAFAKKSDTDVSADTRFTTLRYRRLKHREKFLISRPVLGKCRR